MCQSRATAFGVARQHVTGVARCNARSRCGAAATTCRTSVRVGVRSGWGAAAANETGPAVRRGPSASGGARGGPIPPAQRGEEPPAWAATEKLQSLTTEWGRPSGLTQRTVPPVLIVVADGEKPGVESPTTLTSTESTMDAFDTVMLFPNIVDG